MSKRNYRILKTVSFLFSMMFLFSFFGMDFTRSRSGLGMRRAYAEESSGEQKGFLESDLTENGNVLDGEERNLSDEREATAKADLSNAADDNVSTAVGAELPSMSMEALRRCMRKKYRRNLRRKNITNALCGRWKMRTAP